MARKIKFRAWLPSLCKIVYIGSPNNDTALWLEEDGYDVVDHFTGSPKSIGNKEDKEDASMLMQFTGLEDKNGNEIYEGDIIQSTSANNESCLSIVVWDNKSARFYGSPFYQEKWIGKNKGISRNATLFIHCQIIGNIFENSELLKS